MSKHYIGLDLRSGNVNICIYRGAIKNLKFRYITLLDLYKLPDLDKRADSCAVSVYVLPSLAIDALSHANFLITLSLYYIIL